ncbi:MAG TPA: histidine kinase [Ideonella sp.]|uniref:sensor histidine kinase n=1 Tax=Ideonella sp. TaxID=1929293 RepID=UPI002E30B557|nr:histidine kinase [Ideonella sp.]HEX5684053.1 histidine kinase [Ideonella sp.]
MADQSISASPAAALPLRAWALRSLQHVGYALVLGTGVAVLLMLLSRRSSWHTLVYSWCISIGCSVSIDVLRHLATAWVRRHETQPSIEKQVDWPGWGWMSACLGLGTLSGITLGTQLGNLLIGREGHVFSGGPGMVAAMLVISLLPGVGITYYYRAKGRLQTAQALAETAQRQASETRLKLLESQLEPHMLFNTLANLRALIALDPERAQAMLDRLIDFLRATLGASRAPLHPLSAEFARLADYLALMQIRMGDRLRVELELPDALAATPIPPLLLQPLVENAIKHGLEPKRGAGLIRVQALVDGAELVLRVTDSGVGPQASAAAATAGTRFGLAQVRERLTTLYGDRASLQLEPGPPNAGGTVVTLRWPLAATPTTLSSPSSMTP